MHVIHLNNEKTMSAGQSNFTT